MKQLALATLLATLVGAAAGAMSAGFLFVLDLVTRYREHHGWMVWGLPLVGICLAAFASRAPYLAKGSTVLYDAVHGGPRVPLALAPLVAVGTWASHAVGASVGREGTAVQMSGAVADAIASRASVDRGLLLRAGIAGGFGAVFGTPFAGAAFGVESPTFGRPSLRAVLPCAVASFGGDLVARRLGAVHSVFPRVASVSALEIAKALPLALAAGVVVLVYLEALGRLKALLARAPLVQPAFGLAVVMLAFALGTTSYLGLGVPTIEQAFRAGAPVPAAAFAWKALFTLLSVGSGYVGGDVTPLFFVGATLGHTLSDPLSLRAEVAASVGMAAVFGAASNAPFALAVMAAELSGIAVLPAALVAALVACVVVGPRSLYPTQRLAWDKRRRRFDPPVPVAEAARGP